MKALVEPLLVENPGRRPQFGGRQIGLPANTRGHCEVGGGLPGILQIKTHIVPAEIIRSNGAIYKCRRPSHHEVAQRQTSILGAELELTGSVRTREPVRHGMDIVGSKSNLVCSARPTQILGKLVGRRVGYPGIVHGCATWPGAECARDNQDRYLPPIRRVVKVLNSHITPSEKRS